MKSPSEVVNRRKFLEMTASVGASLALLQPLTNRAAPSTEKKRIGLGLDNFAVRAMNWKAPALLEYAASLKLDSILISDLDAFESLEENSLKEVKRKAADLGLQIHAGTWSICPTAKAFKNKWGTAEEHLALAIRVAQAVGSPVIRCVLGGA